MHTEGHDMGKDTRATSRRRAGAEVRREHPGYETTRTSTSAASRVSGGLFGFVIIFFFFCFGWAR
jgi:hypothetical protein